MRWCYEERNKSPIIVYLEVNNWTNHSNIELKKWGWGMSQFNSTSPVSSALLEIIWNVLFVVSEIIDNEFPKIVSAAKKISKHLVQI